MRAVRNTGRLAAGLQAGNIALGDIKVDDNGRRAEGLGISVFRSARIKTGSRISVRVAWIT